MEKNGQMNCYYQEHKQQQMLVRMWRKWNPHTLLVGMQISKTTMENSIKASQKNENITAI
jgi:hypothetical protein